MDMLPVSRKLPGKRELNRIRNRKAILNAARECFSELGYDNATIRDIIKRTQLAAGTFYNYFASKQDIFVALLTDFLSQMNRDLTHSRRSADTTIDFIHQAYLALYSATARDPLIYELAHKNDQALQKLFGSGLLRLSMLSLEEDVREAKERGLLPDVDTEYLCAAFFGVAYELSLKVARRAHQKPEAGEAEAQRAAQFSTALFLGGIPELTKVP
ncbi:TetR/AcrR family transcriptional regulator [Marinobacter salinisoli]|uniref:TetR/AcrR family transcriptional regulator n=1 Tax=Marinobacter salinisoli TaxID=2769486 RepID=A0ABX7MQA0_9GAMM|nr:TetR/AcrR family transcriptional regulator [Marinobacter salinisoli]QSP93569.1 TetR/AcrR family transcriptional regulator [Marinobacter salinisoli]